MPASSGAVALRHPITILALSLVACGGAQPAEPPASPANVGQAPAAVTASGDEPKDQSASEAQPGAEAPAPADLGAPGQYTTLDTHTAKDTHGTTASALTPTKTEALVKFVVVDKDNGPIQGIVVSLTAPDGKKFYTEETDATGYGEVLVPVAQKYDVVYVSLGRKDVTASVDVEDKPKQTVKLTLRYKRFVAEKKAAKAAKAEPERFVLDGVNFDTKKATIRPDSFARLDSVVEYMTHKKSSRIEISGHTDNVGKKDANKKLSEKRAQACRDYVISKGIDGSRIQAVGYGDERPIAPNDSAENRQQNRRIEATEL